MENNRDYYSTYKFYDESGRRLSAFARSWIDKDANRKVIIIIFHCNKLDNFNKSKGNQLYIDYKNAGYRTQDETSPLEFVVDVDIEKGEKVSFLEWMEQNYYKSVPVPTEQNYLICLGKDKIGRAMSKVRIDYNRIADIILSSEEDEAIDFNNN